VIMMAAIRSLPKDHLSRSGYRKSQPNWYFEHETRPVLFSCCRGRRVHWSNSVSGASIILQLATSYSVRGRGPDSHRWGGRRSYHRSVSQPKQPRRGWPP
jgi:hypothetical protein